MASERVSDAVEELPTDTIERVQVSLRGFQLIAFMVGKRVVRLPHPAVRILGVAIVSSALISQLAIEYLDDELVRRETREQLTGDERARIESQGSGLQDAERSWRRALPWVPIVMNRTPMDRLSGRFGARRTPVTAGNTGSLACC